MAADLLLRARRAIVDGAERSVAIVISDGVVAEITAYDADVAAREVITLADDEVLLPGLVDTHVHVNEPGRTEWEGFASATAAAAAGGVTTIVDMPLNSIPPTTTVAGLDAKRAVAEGRVLVDVGFWGGAVPGNLDDLGPLARCRRLRLQVLPARLRASRSSRRWTPTVSTWRCRSWPGTARCCSCTPRTPGAIGTAPAGPAYAGFLASRPRRAEEAAIERVIAAARHTGGRAHVVHLSDADAIPMLRAARADGVRVTVETCPHYLTFAAEEIADGATDHKCCPPIRERDNREPLWAGLANGDLDLVVTDHSPCTADLKCGDTGDFAEAWGGIASLELGLPAVWTQARERGHSLRDVVHWMAEAPADLVGLATKGRIAARRRRRPLRLRTRRDLGRRPRAAAPPQPRDALRRAYAHRHGPAHLAAWPCRRPGRQGAPQGRLLRRGDA